MLEIEGDNIIDYKCRAVSKHNQVLGREICLTKEDAPFSGNSYYNSGYCSELQHPETLEFNK